VTGVLLVPVGVSSFALTSCLLRLLRAPVKGVRIDKPLMHASLHNEDVESFNRVNVAADDTVQN
jgi:hypothetical protein